MSIKDIVNDFISSYKTEIKSKLIDIHPIKKDLNIIFIVVGEKNNRTKRYEDICNVYGIPFDTWEYEENVDEDALYRILLRLESNNSIYGIYIQDLHERFNNEMIDSIIGIKNLNNKNSEDYFETKVIIKLIDYYIKAIDKEPNTAQVSLINNRYRLLFNQLTNMGITKINYCSDFDDKKYIRKIISNSDINIFASKLTDQFITKNYCNNSDSLFIDMGINDIHNDTIKSIIDPNFTAMLYNINNLDEFEAYYIRDNNIIYYDTILKLQELSFIDNTIITYTNQDKLTTWVPIPEY